MRNHSKKASVAVTGKMTVGLDLGDQHSYYYTLDAAGENVESGRVKTSGEGLEKRFGGQEAARVVIEAGTHSRVRLKVTDTFRDPRGESAGQICSS